MLLEGFIAIWHHCLSIILLLPNGPNIHFVYVWTTRRLHIEDVGTYIWPKLKNSSFIFYRNCATVVSKNHLLLAQQKNHIYLLCRGRRVGGWQTGRFFLSTKKMRNKPSLSLQQTSSQSHDFRLNNWCAPIGDPIYRQINSLWP